MRETLFNWLGQDLTGLNCLDLYAGSGALGFEAASRGAKSVVMVERERAAHAALTANRSILNAEHTRIERADALDYLHGASDVYDVVFLDPPFAMYTDGASWNGLFELLRPRLSAQALVYRESGMNLPAPSGWKVHKQGRAGQVYYQLLKKPDETL